jgi:hypothetical protein
VKEPTNTCSVCGNTNQAHSLFCESCGSPMDQQDQTRQSKLPEIAIGYANLNTLKEENRDFCCIIDSTSLFNEENHRIISFIILNRLANVIDGPKILNDLNQNIFYDRKNDFQKLLDGVKSRILSIPYLNEDNSDSGFLIGILDNKTFSFTSFGSPRVMVIGKEDYVQSFQGNKSSLNVQKIDLQQGNFLCVVSFNILDLLGDSEVITRFKNAINPQAACEDIVKCIRTKKTDLNLALAIAQMISC